MLRWPHGPDRPDPAAFHTQAACQLRHFMNLALYCTITPCPASAPLICTAIERLPHQLWSPLRWPASTRYRRVLLQRTCLTAWSTPIPCTAIVPLRLVSLRPTQPLHPHRPITIALVLVPRLRSIRLLSRPDPTCCPMLRTACAGPHRTLIHCFSHYSLSFHISLFLSFYLSFSLSFLFLSFFLFFSLNPHSFHGTPTEPNFSSDFHAFSTVARTTGSRASRLASLTSA